tara:strand:+ start:202 stop:435 length:234 start_codon:yes stop_codon:yes gene_type:complete
MKNLILLVAGILIGTCFAWPGVVTFSGWKCFLEVVEKSNKEEISLRAALAISPKYLLDEDNNSFLSKIRIVSDACFR